MTDYYHAKLRQIENFLKSRCLIFSNVRKRDSMQKTMLSPVGSPLNGLLFFYGFWLDAELFDPAVKGRPADAEALRRRLYISAAYGKRRHNGALAGLAGRGRLRLGVFCAIQRQGEILLGQNR